MSKQEDIEWVYDYILGKISSAQFRNPIKEFIDQNCETFIDIQENTFEQGALFNEFVQLVENQLDNLMKELNITEEMFSWASQRGLQSEKDKKYFEQWISFTNYNHFKAIMTRRNYQLLSSIENEMKKKGPVEAIPVQWTQEQRLQQEGEMKEAIKMSLELEEQKRRWQIIEEEELKRALKLSQMENDKKSLEASNYQQAPQSTIEETDPLSNQAQIPKASIPEKNLNINLQSQIELTGKKNNKINIDESKIQSHGFGFGAQLKNLEAEFGILKNDHKKDVEKQPEMIMTNNEFTYEESYKSTEIGDIKANSKMNQEISVRVVNNNTGVTPTMIPELQQELQINTNTNTNNSNDWLQDFDPKPVITPIQHNDNNNLPIYLSNEPNNQNRKLKPIDRTHHSVLTSQNMKDPNTIQDPKVTETPTSVPPKKEESSTIQIASVNNMSENVEETPHVQQADTPGTDKREKIVNDMFDELIDDDNPNIKTPHDPVPNNLNDKDREKIEMFLNNSKLPTSYETNNPIKQQDLAKIKEKNQIQQESFNSKDILDIETTSEKDRKQPITDTKSDKDFVSAIDQIEKEKQEKLKDYRKMILQTKKEKRDAREKDEKQTLSITDQLKWDTRKALADKLKGNPGFTNKQ